MVEQFNQPAERRKADNTVMNNLPTYAHICPREAKRVLLLFLELSFLVLFIINKATPAKECKNIK